MLGRLLLQALDRRDPAFGDPPPDDALSVAHRVAWDVYAVGRLQRLGYRAQRQRRLYAFRNRHGFTDAADAAFDAAVDRRGPRPGPTSTALSDDAGPSRRPA